MVRVLKHLPDSTRVLQAVYLREELTIYSRIGGTLRKAAK
jgi:hypothetical protein